MNVTHTALPWHDLHGQYVIPATHVERRVGGSTNKQQDREEFAHVICRIERNSNRFSEEESDANAAYIVKAVNCHEQLVTALRALFNDYKALADSGDAGNWSLEDLEVGKQAVVALAAAGEPV